MDEAQAASESDRTHSTVEAYAGSNPEGLPIGAYAGLMALFAGVFGSALVLGAKRRRLPNGLSARDIVLLGLATHRLSRVLTRDKVAIPLRMPFTKYEGKGGAGEVNERPRGTGLQKAIGGLLTCQFCAGPWIAASLTSAFVARPKETRVVASAFSIVAVSDFLHQLYTFTRRLSP